MIQPKHLPRIKQFIEQDMREDGTNILEATARYLDNIPYTDREIKMICEHLKVHENEFLRFAATPEQIEEFNNQYECGVY